MLLGSCKIIQRRSVVILHNESLQDCNNFHAGAVGSKDTIYSKAKSLCYDIRGLLGTI